ncbi:MAG: type III-B CRISPR module RAMP protein Cmr1 [Candidatus Poribacteria bacterium]
MSILTVKMRTITPVWTGGLDRTSDFAKTSGLVGSIRWWYESLVRGLGGYACDPTSPDSCIFDSAEYERTHRIEDGLQDVCFACRLFGCTGWSGKFMLLVADSAGNVGDVNVNKSGVDFTLKLVELKPIIDVERWLLSAAFWIIDEYGSIGGKTTAKPPKRPDYGIVEVVENIDFQLTRDDVVQWIEEQMNASEVMQSKLSMLPREYPNLRYFFFHPDDWLDTNEMNRLLRSDRTKFLAGQRGVSKKVFSFKDGSRFWGYTTGDEMLQQVMNTLASMEVEETMTGGDVLDEL